MLYTLKSGPAAHVTGVYCVAVHQVSARAQMPGSQDALLHRSAARRQLGYTCRAWRSGAATSMSVQLSDGCLDRVRDEEGMQS